MNSRSLLEGLLSKRLRIKIQDGRIIDGHFMCTDGSCNIVLSNCEEFLSQSHVDQVEACNGGHTTNIRTLGLAIVPGQQILSIAVQEYFLSNELKEFIKK